eukprot:13449444-Alexandrium_andersonii.AAC.1
MQAALGLLPPGQGVRRLEGASAAKPFELAQEAATPDVAQHPSRRFSRHWPPSFLRSERTVL